MKVIKRDGNIVEYNPEKIKTAIKKANEEVSRRDRANEKEIQEIIDYVEDLKKIKNISRRYSRYNRRKVDVFWKI